MRKSYLFILVLLLFISLIAIGTNPYLIPGYYDNALYYSLGRSLSKGSAYQFMGNYIVDWPPLFPAVLALSFSLFEESILIAKITTAGFAIFGLTAVYALLRKEERPQPLLTVFFMSLLPVSLAMGTRIAPEWMFISISFAFLYVVEILRTRQGIFLGLLAGALLGAASVTRYIGVLLGVALIAQCWLIYRQEGKLNIFKKIAPEVIAAITGAFIFLGWVLWIFLLEQSGSVEIQTGNYEKFGFSIFSHLNLNEMVLSLSDLLFQGTNLSKKFEGGEWVVLVVSYGIFFTMILGFVQQLKSKNIKASDFYVLTTIIVLTCYQWKLSRYLLIIFPFLFSYLIQGGQLIFGRTKYVILSVCWILLLLAINAHLLFKGNNVEFNGLSPLVSPTGSDFYRGEWKAIYEVSEKIPKSVKDSECVVGVDPILSQYVKYIHVWTGCEVMIGADENNFDHYIKSP